MGDDAPPDSGAQRDRDGVVAAELALEFYRRGGRDWRHVMVDCREDSDRRRWRHAQRSRRDYGGGRSMDVQDAGDGNSSFPEMERGGIDVEPSTDEGLGL